MTPSEIKHIGRKITIKALRDSILDLKITDKDTILLTQIAFDNIVLEYRETYNESVTLPYILLGVLIKEDTKNIIPHDRIGIIKNDTESARKPPKPEDEFNDWFIAYRCGWCGGIVDKQGYVMEGTERAKTIRYIENYPNPTVKHTHGKCCPNGNE